MQLRFVDADPTAHDTPLLAVGVPAGSDGSTPALQSLDAALNGAISRAIHSGDMKGGDSDKVLLYGTGNGPDRVLLLGIGRSDDLDSEDVRRMAGRAVRAAEDLGVTELSISSQGLPALEGAGSGQAIAEGATLATWRFRELKQTPDDPADAPTQVTSVDVLGSADQEDDVRLGAALGTAENFARTLQARPGNVATPTHLADEATKMAAEVGLGITVFDEAHMLEERMHALLSVSRGSEEEARFIILEHKGGSEGDAPLVLVGKGLTFDAGGISLKPPQGMEDMKFDMSGGAAVIAAMRAIAEIDVPANVIGLVPSSENLPSGTATKPGDVIQSRGGKSIEVINTDAEGRLILADALSYGASLEPAAMIDCATLTGSVIIALGHNATAVLGNDGGLVDEIIAAGDVSGERCWPLPMWDDYRKQLDSEYADLKNVGGRPAGSITAACFLSEFVGDTAWAHLDIAGTAYGDGKLPYHRKGGYGCPTRLLVEWVRGRAG